MAYPLTMVSGYWRIINKHGDDYLNWFENTLYVNCPFVFFGTFETIEIAKKYRKNYPTYYIELSIEQFETYLYKDKMIIDNTHSPSVELNLIWNEKIFLIKKSIELNPYNSDFFMWYDAGCCYYRYNNPTIKPFPNIQLLNNLPKNKLIFTESQYYFDENRVNEYNYHFICGTVYLLHKDFINTIAELYKEKMSIINTDKIYTDQVILTHIYRDNPALFLSVGYGYGSIIPFLL